MNDDNILATIREPLNRFTKSIKSMDTRVDKLVKFYLEHGRGGNAHGGLEDDGQSLSSLSRARLELAIVSAMNTCYWLSLVTHGEDPKDSDVSKEMQRVKLFKDRAREVEESLLNSNSFSTKRPKIDKEASKRLCMNNMTLVKSNQS